MFERFRRTKNAIIAGLIQKDDSTIQFVQSIIQLLKLFDLQAISPESYLSMGLINKAAMMTAEIIKMDDPKQKEILVKRENLLTWLSTKESPRVKRFINEVLGGAGIAKTYDQIDNLKKELP